MNAVEAFDEIAGYITPEQAGVIYRAMLDDNKVALMAIWCELHAAALLRIEEIQDIKRNERNARADDLYSAWKDSLPAMLQAQVGV